MDWSKLKEYKCPQCGSDLLEDALPQVHVCSDDECGFKIGAEKLQSIVESRPRKKNRYVEPDRSNWT